MGVEELDQFGEVRKGSRQPVYLGRELSAFYSTIGRPSIAPELMIRMLLVGYCFGIRSERRLCEPSVSCFAAMGLMATSPTVRNLRGYVAALLDMLASMALERIQSRLLVLVPCCRSLVFS